jgi:hypothetical protein
MNVLKVWLWFNVADIISCSNRLREGSRDLANQPGVLPHADIFVVGDSDKVSKTRFMERLNIEIQKIETQVFVTQS